MVKTYLCRICKRRLSADDFHVNSFYSNGIDSKCSECERNRHLMKMFGITRQQYDELLASQDGCCAICHTDNPSGIDPRRKMFCVDHDHETGKIRGLLCINCNRALGLLGDNEEVVARALRYMQGEARK